MNVCFFKQKGKETNEHGTVTMIMENAHPPHS